MPLWCFQLIRSCLNNMASCSIQPLVAPACVDVILLSPSCIRRSILPLQCYAATPFNLSWCGCRRRSVSRDRRRDSRDRDRVRRSSPARADRRRDRWGQRSALLPEFCHNADIFWLLLRACNSGTVGQVRPARGLAATGGLSQMGFRQPCVIWPPSHQAMPEQTQWLLLSCALSAQERNASLIRFMQVPVTGPQAQGFAQPGAGSSQGRQRP